MRIPGCPKVTQGIGAAAQEFQRGPCQGENEGGDEGETAVLPQLWRQPAVHKEGNRANEGIDGHKDEVCRTENRGGSIPGDGQCDPINQEVEEKLAPLGMHIEIAQSEYWGHPGCRSYRPTAGSK